MNLNPLGIFIIKVGQKISQLGGIIYKFNNPLEQASSQWREQKGDQTLRVDYDLNEQSIVFDLGGYEGDWTTQIIAMYNCRVFVFEPVSSYYNFLVKKFNKNSRIKVYPCGLDKETRSVEISIAGVSSSIYQNKPGGEKETIQLVRAVDFFQENRINHIDLMKINIEGSEYDLLDHLLEENYIRNIDSLQIQFHNFVPSARSRMEKIQSQLRRTHQLTYQYPFIWENWTLKNEV